MSESTRNAVLGLLARRPMYGYALRNHFSQWPLDESLLPGQRSVYAALEKLLEEQLIEPQEGGRRDRRLYAVTAKGASRYEEWLRTTPGTFDELWLRVGTAQKKDYPALRATVIAAEHGCLARLRELQEPNLEAVAAGGGSTEAIATAMLTSIEISQVTARSRLLRDLRRAFTAVIGDGPTEDPAQ